MEKFTLALGIGSLFTVGGGCLAMLVFMVPYGVSKVVSLIGVSLLIGYSILHMAGDST